jgi:tetratricopeptide (TPR) repeat protein
MFISWYLLSDVELLTGNIDKAFEITGKAVMIIEKDDKLSKIFSIYFKYQLARILKAKQDYTNAEKCIKQSLNTASQYGFIYNQATGMMLLAEILNDLAKQTEDQSQAELYHQEISSVLEKWQIIVKDLSNPLFLERLKTPAKK